MDKKKIYVITPASLLAGSYSAIRHLRTDRNTSINFIILLFTQENSGKSKY